MGDDMARRDFLKASAAAAAGAALASSRGAEAGPEGNRGLRLGVVGVGGRGTGLMATLLTMEGVEVPAVCDIDPSRVKRAQDIVEKARGARPEGYSRDEEHFKELMDRDDLDAVIIATYWEWHTPMAVYGMRAGKYVGVEVPAAMSFEECWALVDAHEETGVPCMMLENWSFRRDNLAVLGMIREGLLGEIVHCHCAHSHDCIDHWFFYSNGTDRWPAKYLVKYNRDQYPTHSLGPVASWMDIGCGDYYAYATSTATSSIGINAYFARKFGPDHPGATRKYAQGDIVTTVIRTHKGRSIAINYDMQLPRPYDNRWMIQGTLGIYNEQRDAVYLTGVSPQYHQWEPFGPYQEKYDHAWWKAPEEGAAGAGHGGTDYLELREFLRAVRSKTQTPIDVYDSVAMSVIIPLSERSIANGSAPVECPDFTRGKWKTKQPAFAIEA